MSEPTHTIIITITITTIIIITTPTGSVLVPHASELPYVFGGGSKLLVAGEEADLAIPFTGYWASFAATGVPRGVTSKSSAWPPYARDADTILLIDIPSAGGIRTHSHFRHAACDFWDGFVPQS